MKLLCISDRVDSMLQGPALNDYASGVDAVVSCGDLPFAYLEYIVTFLNVPLYYVLGNHDPAEETGKFPGGCIPLDGSVVESDGAIFAGLSGSPLYSGGPNQYSHSQMSRNARALSLKIRARALFGRPKPTIFVTHSPPFGLGDAKDQAHIGFESYLGLIDRYSPSHWLHGHVHLYGPNHERLKSRGETKVLNVYGHQFVEV